MSDTFVSTLNAAAAGYGYLQSIITRREKVFGMPPALGIELTNICNLRCPQCNSGSGLMTRERGFMSMQLFEKILEETGRYLLNINLYFQGEPMMHPAFFEILDRCGNLRSTLSTNGHFLSAENSAKLVRSGLSTLLISLDGMDQETYSLYRVNGTLGTVKEGIMNIAKAKKQFGRGPRLIIQFLVNRYNEHQAGEAKEFAVKAGALFRLKSMQIIREGSHHEWLPLKRRHSRYDQDGKGYSVKGGLPDRCARLWFNPVITWDGKVVPCCFDKNAEYIMGDLNGQTFREIWKGDRYSKFRQGILSGRKSVDICRNCISGIR